MTSVDVPQREKDVSEDVVQKLHKFLRIFDFVVNDIKKLNNAILNFPREDPAELVKKKNQFKRYKDWLDKSFKVFTKELTGLFEALEIIHDGEVDRVRENIMINLDNIIELLGELYDLFQIPAKDFKNQLSTKIGEIIKRCDDMRRLIREELIDHLVVDVVGKKKRVVSHYFNRRMERMAKWHLSNILT
jgi:hypothetical protein